MGEVLAEERVATVVADAAAAIEAAGIAYALIGGIASSLRGRPRATDDIDFLVKPSDAADALRALGEAGFETEETNPKWIYKATRDGLIVDLMFAISGGIYFDDEMAERSTLENVGGRRVRVLSPEDLIVIKAIAHDDQSPRHWYDALGIIADAGELDWDYIVNRASHGARRVLSLLLYAQSIDLIVPDDVIRRLFHAIYDGSS